MSHDPALPFEYSLQSPCPIIGCALLFPMSIPMSFLPRHYVSICPMIRPGHYSIPSYLLVPLLDVPFPFLRPYHIGIFFHVFLPRHYVSICPMIRPCHSSIPSNLLAPLLDMCPSLSYVPTMVIGNFFHVFLPRHYVSICPRIRPCHSSIPSNLLAPLLDVLFSFLCPYYGHWQIFPPVPTQTLLAYFPVCPFSSYSYIFSLP